MSMNSVFADTGIYTYPHNAVYSYGIKPNHYSQLVMNDDVQQAYTNWFNHYVTSNGCPQNCFRVKRTEENDDTVSEGIGYGMLISLYMSSSNNNTKKYFDGFYNYYKSYRDNNGLMHWKISKLGDILGLYSATDADLDVAMALILAARQWGNNTGINYKEEALDLINIIMEFDVEANTFVLTPGDAWGSGDIVNPSYIAPAYFSIFYQITGDEKWRSVLEKNYDILQYIYNRYAYGLMPDWCKSDGTRSEEYGYYYYYDACRVPWRIGPDYLWNGKNNDDLSYNLNNKLSDFMYTQTTGDPSKIGSKYNVTNGQKVENNNNAAFVGPIGVSSMVWGNQVWCNTNYRTLRGFTVPNNYYLDSLRLLSLLVMTGNMPNIIGDSLTVNVSFPVEAPQVSDHSQISILGTIESTAEVKTISVKDQDGNSLTAGINKSVSISTQGNISGTIDVGLLSSNYPKTTFIRIEVEFCDGTGIHHYVAMSENFWIHRKSNSEIKLFNNLIHTQTGEKCTILYGNMAKSFNAEIKIYNLRNKLVRSLITSQRDQGMYTIEWDGKDDDNASVASGIYIVKIKLDNNARTEKIAVVR